MRACRPATSWASLYIPMIRRQMPSVLIRRGPLSDCSTRTGDDITMSLQVVEAPRKEAMAIGLGSLRPTVGRLSEPPAL